MSETAGPSGSHRGSIWIAGALVVLDGVFLGQGIISMLFGAVLVFIYLPALLIWFLLKKNRADVMFGLQKFGIYLLAVGLAVGLVWGNNRIALSRSQDLIAAIHAYHAKHGQYPKKLDQLVPEFIDRVPEAKYTGFGREFIYLDYPDDAVLMYVYVPPFSRKRYRFSTGKWDLFD